MKGDSLAVDTVANRCLTHSGSSCTPRVLSARRCRIASSVSTLPDRWRYISCSHCTLSPVLLSSLGSELESESEWDSYGRRSWCKTLAAA